MKRLCVFCGSRSGPSPVYADAARRLGALLVDRELAHPHCTALHITRSMHERKALMADLSDAFVGLPGGYGTFDETFEMLTWSQLGLHQKPVGLLNVAGYFDRLVEFLDHTVREGFIKPAHRQLLVH